MAGARARRTQASECFSIVLELVPNDNACRQALQQCAQDMARLNTY